MRPDYKVIREFHLFESEFKLKHLGYGEWVEELDYIIFKYLDYECIIQRILIPEPYAKKEMYFGGHFCGYVKIPNNHPYYNKSIDDMDIDAHGGLTFGELNLIDKSYWIGYDCAHSCDIVPTMQLVRKLNKILSESEKISYNHAQMLMNYPISTQEYRNIKYNIDICQEIIEKLILINAIESLKEYNDENESINPK